MAPPSFLPPQPTNILRQHTSQQPTNIQRPVTNIQRQLPLGWRPMLSSSTAASSLQMRHSMCSMVRADLVAQLPQRRVGRGQGRLLHVTPLHPMSMAFRLAQCPHAAVTPQVLEPARRRGQLLVLILQALLMSSYGLTARGMPGQHLRRHRYAHRERFHHHQGGHRWNRE